MCGIGGVLMFPMERNKLQLEFIRELAKNIAKENEVRGSDSTGFACFNRQTQSIMKQPIRARRFVGTEAFKTFIGRAINQNTKNILIHTRAATKGSYENNLNNHPIESHRYIGVHNGVIYNDDELFAQHKMFRAGEVDSEVIFRLLDTQGDKLDEKSLKWVAEQLSGAFTTAFVSKKERNKLYLIRNDNPVTLYYIASLNVIAFASMPHFVERAITEANKLFEGFVGVVEEDVVKMEPSRQTIYSFDTNKNNPVEQLMQKPLTFTENYGGWGARYYSWGDDDYFFGRSAAKDAQTVKNTEEASTALDSIKEYLTDADREKLEQALIEIESNAWSEGWTKGRESLGQEMEEKASISYEEGFEQGYSQGFHEGFSDGKEESEKQAIIL